ncbi:MAG: FAD-dependent oxidoreductase [Turicibacter sp.]|nr:FAD-dependent oxidoreductase [Turicibacter sp.]
MKKKLFLFALVLFLAVGLAACNNDDNGEDVDEPDTEEATGNEEDDNGTGFTPGTFTGTAYGWGGEITVEVVFTEDRIDAVTVTEHNETRNIAIPVIERIPAEIVDYQSLAVDGVTGATASSFALIAAVRDAVEQAGGDVDALLTPLPEVVPNAPVTIETEVLVVGSGIAGLASAIEAADAGADVLVIEKLAFFGGNTAVSASIIQAAGTPLQAEQGVEDSAELYEAFLLELARGEADPDMIHHIAHTSADTIAWLEGMGVVFQDALNVYHYRQPTLRGHVTIENMGYGLTIPMIAHAESLGAEFMAETTAVSLIVEDGVVVGVNATDRTGGEVTIMADAVILATGGFDRNPELMAQYQPLAINPVSLGIVGVTGDGLLMGREVGADSIMVPYTIGLPTMAQPLHGVIVGPSGLRFFDESGYALTRMVVAFGHGYDHFYSVFDQADYSEDLADLIAEGRVFTADTIEELAELIDMDPAVLAATVARYNEMVAAGVDTDFDKPADHLAPIEEGPFFARIFDRHTIFGTQGGLRIDLHGHVIDTDGNIIPGLFAAGEVANAQFLPVEYGGSGTALALYSNMARLAGVAAAEFALE